MEKRVGKYLGTLYYGAALGYLVVEEHLVWCLGPSLICRGSWDLGEY